MRRHVAAKLEDDLGVLSEGNGGRRPANELAVDVGAERACRCEPDHAVRVEPLPPEAVEIIESMPRVAPEIFPYSTDAISAGFTRACQQLEINDLRFHDLRHEGVSRLFELGKTIPQVAAVSGHRSWSSLQRYTHLRQSGDKYVDWHWLPILTAPAGK